MEQRDPITFFAQTNARHNPHQPFGIKQSDRFSHMLLLGKTGVGKTSLIETMAMSDIVRGYAVAVIDPHGDLVTRLAARVPKERLSDLIFFDAPNPTQPYGYNPLRNVAPAKIPLAASGLLGAFQTIWTGNDWGNRIEHILRNALHALFEHGNATLADVLRLLVDKPFRMEVMRHVTNPIVKAYWQDEFAGFDPRYRQQLIGPVQTKIASLLADPVLYRIFTKPEQDIRFREVMDTGKILLVNLAKGALGDDSSRLLGSLLVSTLNLAAFSRVDIPEDKRRDFVVYIDECQEILSTAVAHMVAELRKMRVALVLGTQQLSALEPETRHAILGNVGSLVSFRIGPEDAPIIAKEFETVFTTTDLINLPNYAIYLKLMIDRSPSKPFSANTLTPEALAEHLHWEK